MILCWVCFVVWLLWIGDSVLCDFVGWMGCSNLVYGFGRCEFVVGWLCLGLFYGVLICVCFFCILGCLA